MRASRKSRISLVRGEGMRPAIKVASKLSQQTRAFDTVCTDQRDEDLNITDSQGQGLFTIRIGQPEKLREALV